MLSDRDLEIVRYVMSKNIISLKDLESYISTKYGISAKGAYKIIKRLVDANILKFSRTSNKIFVEPHPKFLRLIVELYTYISPERARYFAKSTSQVTGSE